MSGIRARCDRPFDLHIASVDAKLHAIVRDQRVRSAPRELLEHLDQLRLARRAQPLGSEEPAQRAARVHLGAPEMARGARQRLAPARVALGEQRRDTHPDETAREGIRRVAFILDPFKAMLARVGADRLARYVEQRTHEHTSMEARALRHATGPTRSGAAQQVHQHGLGLVVELVSQREHVEGQLGERRIARRAGSGFQALPAFGDAHAAHRERHLQPLAQCAAEARPAVGVRAQAVMDVRRRHLLALCQRVQQHHRIDAAGEAYENALAVQLFERAPDGGGDLSAPGLP